MLGSQKFYSSINHPGKSEAPENSRDENFAKYYDTFIQL